jgi:uncharacterized protein (TIGR02996 family)
MRTLGEVLEEALVHDPHDRAAHMAYADWLSEQSDPVLAARGEFIAVQLALEEAPSGLERQRLEERQQHLQATWQRAWLGELAPWLLDGRRNRSQVVVPEVGLVTFSRGWLDHLVLHDLTVPMAQVVAKVSSLRLLRSLTIWRAPLGFRAGKGCPYDALVRSSNLRNVQRLELVDLSVLRPPVLQRGLRELIRSLPALGHLSFQETDAETESWPSAVGLWALCPLGSPQIRSLSFTSCRDSFPFLELSVDSSLETLQRLSFTQSNNGSDPVLPEGLDELVHAEHWHALRHLRVELDLTDEGYQIICTSPLVEQLDSITLGPLGQGESIAWLVERFPRMKAFRRVASGRWERRPPG